MFTFLHDIVKSKFEITIGNISKELRQWEFFFFLALLV